MRRLLAACATVVTVSALLAHAASQATPEPNPAAGKQLFEKRCAGCHSLTQNREGPPLAAVYGRTSGTTAGFTYSPALQQARIAWNDVTLDKWLTDPDTFIPGNNMGFSVAKPQERKDLIAFLKQTAGR